MFEESRENTGGVIAGMLRSLEDGHLDIVPSAELKKAELAASPANSSSDEVLEMAGDFNYDGYQVVRREFFAHINEPSVTFNNYKFYVNTACLNRFPQVDYVQVGEQDLGDPSLSGGRSGCLRLVHQRLRQT